jgi:hypothetical protein
LVKTYSEVNLPSHPPASELALIWTRNSPPSNTGSGDVETGYITGSTMFTNAWEKTAWQTKLINIKDINGNTIARDLEHKLSFLFKLSSRLTVFALDDVFRPLIYFS